MPLVIAPPNKELKIVKILADEKTNNNFESFVITLNSTITFLTQRGGNVICKVCEGRLALDKDIATKIVVA